MSAGRLGSEYIETLIIGGGQAGLAMSHMLSRRGRSHLVVEQRRVGERWPIWLSILYAPRLMSAGAEPDISGGRTPSPTLPSPDLGAVLI